MVGALKFENKPLRIRWYLFATRYTTASIAKLFIRLRITRKKCIHVAQERMTPYNLHCRQLFFQWRRTVDPAKVYFFDETHFNCVTDEREYGRTDSGFACPVLRQKSRARAGKFSTLGVCGFNEGVLQAIPVEGNFTADLITDVIENQVLPLLPANSYLVADNASVHNEIVLCRILARKNITLVKLPVCLVEKINFSWVNSPSPLKKKFTTMEIVGCHPFLSHVNAFLSSDAEPYEQFRY